MSELLVSAGLTAAACASLFETWNERSRFHSLTRTVVVRQIPPSVGPSYNSAPVSSNQVFPATPPQTPSPSQQGDGSEGDLPPPAASVANSSDDFDNGIRISHGGPSLPSLAHASPLSSARSYSYSWGGPVLGGWNSSGVGAPFGNAASPAAAAGFPFNPLFPMMGLGTNPMLTPGRQLYQNADGSFTEVTVSGSQGVEDSGSSWMSRKLYYYGLVPAAAVWRTHRLCNLQAPFLAQLGMWRACFYLGTVVPLQTVYTVCIINSVFQWLTGLSSASAETPLSQTTKSEGGFWESQMQDPLRRHLGFDESTVSLYGDQSSVSMNMSSPGRWLSRASSAVVWNFAVWPGLVFLGTSFITIPASILGARLAFAVRARNSFATGGPLAPFGV